MPSSRQYFPRTCPTSVQRWNVCLYSIYIANVYKMLLQNSQALCLGAPPHVFKIINTILPCFNQNINHLLSGTVKNRSGQLFKDASCIILCISDLSRCILELKIFTFFTKYSIKYFLSQNIPGFYHFFVRQFM